MYESRVLTFRVYNLLQNTMWKSANGTRVAGNPHDVWCHRLSPWIISRGRKTGKGGDTKLNAYVEGWAGQIQKYEEIQT